MDSRPRLSRIFVAGCLIGWGAGLAVHFGLAHRPFRVGAGGLELDPRAFELRELVFPLLILPVIVTVVAGLVVGVRWRAARRPPPPLPDLRPGEQLLQGCGVRRLGRVSLDMGGAGGFLWITDQRLEFHTRSGKAPRDSLALGAVEEVVESWPLLPLGSMILTVRAQDWQDRRYLMDRLQRERWRTALQAAGVRFTPRAT